MDIFWIIKRVIKKTRSRIFSFVVKKQCNNYTVPLKVNRYSTVNSNTILGKNVNFNGMEILGKGRVVIGDNFHSGKQCMIITHIHNYDKGEAIPYDSTYLHKDVNIGDNVWIGNRVIILGGSTINEGSIIQAGSVVVGEIPKYGIAGGHPAKVFMYRDDEHYEHLKKLKKFH